MKQGTKIKIFLSSLLCISAAGQSDDSVEREISEEIKEEVVLRTRGPKSNIHYKTMSSISRFNTSVLHVPVLAGVFVYLCHSNESCSVGDYISVS